MSQSPRMHPRKASPFFVTSKSLRLGKPVYLQKNAYRDFHMTSVKQVGNLLKLFYENKVNRMQGGRLKRFRGPTSGGPTPTGGVFGISPSPR